MSAQTTEPLCCIEKKAVESKEKATKSEERTGTEGNEEAKKDERENWPTGKEAKMARQKRQLMKTGQKRSQEERRPKEGNQPEEWTEED